MRCTGGLCVFGHGSFRCLRFLPGRGSPQRQDRGLIRHLDSRDWVPRTANAHREVFRLRLCYSDARSVPRRQRTRLRPRPPGRRNLTDQNVAVRERSSRTPLGEVRRRRRLRIVDLLVTPRFQDCRNQRPRPRVGERQDSISQACPAEMRGGVGRMAPRLVSRWLEDRLWVRGFAAPDDPQRQAGTRDRNCAGQRPSRRSRLVAGWQNPCLRHT